ncbi:pyridoxamine 5'-phosphate oxidase family protein [Pseudonocardia sp. GCM10023141]|uniref:pyridoxamine 5'-phosphate oxidase family protein n=1 Tax=Pseudonocardia sp. GCM10023141 TaxID=3252653 RepID=UPI0036094C05
MSRFGQVAFTPAVRHQQEVHGSARAYADRGVGPAGADLLGPSEAAFITARDSFYVATVSESGWPYIQHRGGPPGFVHVLDEATLAWADVRGNRQYVTAGNLDGEDRMAMFFMDYPHQRRLKVLGFARWLDAADHPELAARLAEPGTSGRVEAIATVQVEAFDWNCPQHITPRFSLAELEDAGVQLSLPSR